MWLVCQEAEISTWLMYTRHSTSGLQYKSAESMMMDDGEQLMISDSTVVCCCPCTFQVGSQAEISGNPAVWRHLRISMRHMNCLRDNSRTCCSAEHTQHGRVNLKHSTVLRHNSPATHWWKGKGSAKTVSDVWTLRLLLSFYGHYTGQPLSQHSQLRTGEFSRSKVLLPAWPCW